VNGGVGTVFKAQVKFTVHLKTCIEPPEPLECIPSLRILHYLPYYYYNILYLPFCKLTLSVLISQVIPLCNASTFMYTVVDLIERMGHPPCA
jgi:hypothetical protein